MAFGKNGSPPALLWKTQVSELFFGISDNDLLRQSFAELFQPVVRITARTVDLKLCSLLLVDEEREELWVCSTHPANSYYSKKPPIKIWEGISGRALQEQRTIQVADVSKAPDFRYPEVARKEGLVSLVTSPIKVNGRALGVLNGYSSQPRQFNSDDCTIFEVMTNQAGIVIECELLRREMVVLKNKLKQTEVVAHAKTLLMEKKGLNEDEAYRFLRNTSMASHCPLAEIARDVIQSYASS